MKKHFRLSLALFVSALIFIPASSNAVEYGGIGGRPANPRSDNPRSSSIFIYTLKAGESAQDGIRVYNNTAREQAINVYSVDSALASGGAFTCSQKIEKSKDVGNWITLDTDSVTLKPNSDTVIPFHINVPGNVDVGEHNGCMVVQEAVAATPVDGQSGVVLGFRSALRVAVTIPGKIVKKLDLSSLTIRQQDNGKLLITPTATNGGNVSLDAKLTTDLSALLGTNQASINRGTYPVLPDSTASWNFDNDRPFWGGWYRATVTVTYNNNPGSTLGTRDTSPQTVSRSSGIIFIAPKPLALLIELSVLASIIAVATWFIQRSRHIRRVRHHWSSYAVKDGDTISDVAKQVGISWKQLARANKLRAPYHLTPGQKLKVPPRQED